MCNSFGFPRKRSCLFVCFPFSSLECCQRKKNDYLDSVVWEKDCNLKVDGKRGNNESQLVFLTRQCWCRARKLDQLKKKKIDIIYHCCGDSFKYFCNWLVWRTTCGSIFSHKLESGLDAMIVLHKNTHTQKRSNSVESKKSRLMTRDFQRAHKTNSLNWVDWDYMYMRLEERRN